MMTKINLGCGKKYIDGWVNVDFYDDSKCDIKHDLEVFPWPWEDNSIDEVYMHHFIEHFDSDKVLEIVADDLLNLGYLVETGKKRNKKLEFPFYLVKMEL